MNLNNLSFRDSGLDRAAHARGDKAQTRLLAHPQAQMFLFWRGKPLVAGPDDGELALANVGTGHAMAEYVAGIPMFLGLCEAGAPYFAADVSEWLPSDLPEDINAFLDQSEQRHPGLPGDHRFAELRGVMGRLPVRDAELAATGRGLLEWHRIHGFCANCGAASAPANAGWERDCPACGRKHFPRTDPVVIMLITRGNSVLLGRSPGWPEGMYSLLAGFVEPGETIEAAVRREVFEESGIRVGPVKVLTSQPWPFPASLMIGCSGEAVSDQITIDPAEIEDAIWLSREDMMQVQNGQHPTVKPTRKGAIAHTLIENWLADSLN